MLPDFQIAQQLMFPLDAFWNTFVPRGDVVLDNYEDGYAYRWFPVFEGPHVATFYTEVLKLFAPYPRGALNIVTQ